MKGKAIIVSAPSGAGKTSIVKHLLSVRTDLSFSVSACSRPMRKGEVDGRDYYFLSAQEFRQKIDELAFIEWEEVYPGSYYGTLKSEVYRIWASGKHVIFDVDVKGGVNLKRIFTAMSLSIFVRPPSLEALQQRLLGRGTETIENIRKRLDRAGLEMEYQSTFDQVIMNDQLEEACRKAEILVETFINPPSA
jgi:guanylate kinase